MKKRYIGLRLLILALGVSAAFSEAHAEPAFSECVIFGDSLSDNGNLAVVPEFSFLSSPDLPYNHGFNNGEYAVEVLCEDLGLNADPSLYLTGQPPAGTNYAVADGRAAGSRLIDLHSQLDAFFAWRQNLAPADALYVVWVGGNDLRDARDADDSEAESIMTAAVASIVEAAQRLLVAGAKHVLVVNIPDIGRSPETRLLGDEAFAERATALTQKANKALERAINRLDQPLSLHLTNIRLFDLFRTLERIDRHSERLGYENDQDGCFNSHAWLTFGQILFHPDCEDGERFDEFVFFDEIHPSARIQTTVGIALGNAATSLLNSGNRFHPFGASAAHRWR